MPIFSVEYLTADRHGRIDFHAVGVTDLTDFFRLFGTIEGSVIKTEAVQRASRELKAGVAAFCEARRAQAPQLGAFNKLIDDLSLDEAFLVLPAAQRSSEQVADLEMLVARENGAVTAEDAAATRRFFSPVLDHYDIVNPATDRPNQIGNAQKARRICRFCGGTKAKGATFKGSAHAVSFGLGNVHLKLADECDTCNGFFGRELEPHLIAFLGIQRVMLGIRGRGENGGLPHVKVRGGEMRHDGDRIVIELSADEVEQHDGTLSITLQNDISIIPERCYRTLVKFALSVIPEAELPRLNATIDWVRNGSRPNGRALPSIFTNVVALPPNSSAQIVLFVRRSEQSHLPHVVGEFRLGCYVYTFILPFSALDEGEPAFFGSQQFMATFPHYAGTPGWQSINLDSAGPFEDPAIMRLMPEEAPTLAEPAQMEANPEIEDASSDD